MSFLPNRKIIIVIAIAIMATVLATGGTVFAHEGRHVGEYDLVVGWMTEPAYEGMRNGVDFRVGRASETDHEGGDNGHGNDENAVEGLEDTVQVEITHEPPGTSRVFDLRAVWGSPGEYTTDVLPTAPGAYEFRFFGTIEGLDLDETFVTASLGGGFNDVESSVDIQFPEARPELREVEAALRGAVGASERAEQRAIEAADSVSGVRTLAVIAIVLSIAAGAGSVVVGLKKRQE